MNLLLIRLRCFVRFHKWQHWSKEIDEDEWIAIAFRAGRFRRYRRCSDCHRIEIYESRTYDGFTYFRAWAKVKEEELRYESPDRFTLDKS